MYNILLYLSQEVIFLKDDCLFCTHPCCDICPLTIGDKEYDDFRDLYPDIWSEMKNEHLIYYDSFESDYQSDLLD